MKRMTTTSVVLLTSLVIASSVLSAPAAADPIGDACRSVFSEAICVTLESTLPDIPDQGNESTVVTGTFEEWHESGPVFYFDDYVNVATDLEGWWSINRLNPDRGWFYGYNDATSIAHVTDVSDICEISNASSYEYSGWSVGPVDEGDFLLFHGGETGYYGAFRVDDIYGPEPYSAQTNVTWYVQENGSDNFGPCDSGSLEGCVEAIANGVIDETEIDVSCLV